MRNKKLILLMVVLLALGAIAMAGCGAPPEDDFDMQEEPFEEPGNEEDPFADPEEDDPFGNDEF